VRRVIPVALTSLAVIAFVPTAGGGAAGLALAAVVVALALSLVGAQQQQALPLTAAALAMAIGESVDLGAGGEVHRWAALAALPLVVPAAGLSLVRVPAVAAGLVLIGGAVAGPVRALAYDPLRDRGCSGCLPLPAVLGHRADASWWVLVGGVLALVALGAGLRRPTQRMLLVALLVTGCWALTGWREPRGVVVEATEWALAVAVLAGALSVAGSWSNRARLARLEELFRSGGGPVEGLRAALSDPTAALSFAADGGWIGPDGTVAPTPGQDQVVTPVWVAGSLVARIAHAPDAGRVTMLATSLTPELRIAIEHARLDALLRAQVRELQESRLRLVEAADEERRRVERDLHDGAQQHVLALGYDIRRALATAPADAALQECLSATTDVLAELRLLAHGVYPALLTGAGLGPALESLGRSVVVTALPDRRFAPCIERTAYLLVSELASGERIEVSGSVVDDDLVVCVRGGRLADHSLVGERVTTLGGSLSLTDDLTELRIPCA
jgi:signal transduction histidine kinase